MKLKARFSNEVGLFSRGYGMRKSLGVFVCSNNHLNKLIKLCKAAKKKGIDTTIFFTHLGILSPKLVKKTMSPRPGMPRLSKIVTAMWYFEVGRQKWKISKILRF